MALIRSISAKEVIDERTGEVRDWVVENEILSYQFSCLIIREDENHPDNKVNWSGIVLPKGSSLDDRFTASEFVGIAICEGIP